MVQIVQLRGGTRAEVDALVGAERELIVDTDGDELRLQDGVKSGGFRILNLDQNNLRYQARNGDLTAITSLSANQSGWLVKRGQDSWVLRQLQVNTNHLTLTNANGLVGNPTIGLATTIADPHIFSGQITLQSELQAQGGITGNLTGNVTGNTAGTHTGPVTGEITGNVTGNLTGNSTGTHTGGVDLRSATLQLDNEQVPLTAIAGNANIVQTNDPRLPIVGDIKLRFGDVTTLPAGWALCDGQNGTPDMRNRFPLGAGDGVTAPDDGTIGGVLSHGHTATSVDAGGHTPVVTVANHVLTVQELPAHDHLAPVPSENNAANQFLSDPTTAQWFNDTNTGTPEAHGRTSRVGGGQPHGHGATAAVVPDHNHAVTVQDSADILPPYVALHYMMYIGV